MSRYTHIATRNDAIGTMYGDEHKLDAAQSAGLRVETRYWQDHYTNAHGRHFVVRTRHLKKLGRAFRKSLVAP